MDFAPHLAAMYGAVGELAAAGDVAFLGVLEIADQDIFEAARSGDLRLRYQVADVELKRGDQVVVRGIACQLVEPPQRIGSGHEAIATLVEVQEASAP